MKKFIIASIVGIGLAFSSHAANFAAQSFLNGYNISVPTNSTVTFGNTNILYTTINGGVVYSLTNIMGNSNVIAGDAFQDVNSFSDALGNNQANTTIFVEIGNTNAIPIVTTNSLGAYYLNTNGVGWSWYDGSYAANNPWNPNPGIATSNVYPTLTATGTNILTFTFVRVPDGKRSENQGNTFAFSVKPTGSSVYKFSTNVPSIFLQGCSKVRLQSIAADGISTTSTTNYVNRVEFCGFIP